MTFIVLIFLAAFGIEVIGSYISVLGLAAIFAADPIIMTMAVMLDFAKVMTVSFVYKKWKQMNRLMKTYMVIASTILMIITSSGVFGYLSAQFQQAVVPNKEVAIKLQTLTEEQQRLQARKIEIDKQIANIPANIVRNRIKLIDSFKGETEKINSRLTEIDGELPKLKIESVNKSAHIGPIAYVAEAFDISMEKAVKYVILLIIFVFDPLAVALIIAGNFLLEERAKKKEQTHVDALPSEPYGKEPHPGAYATMQEDNDIPSTQEPSREFLNALSNSDPNGYIDLAETLPPQFNTLDDEYQPQHRPDWKEETLENTSLSDANDSLTDTLPDSNPWIVVPLAPEEVKAIEEVETEPTAKVRTERQLDKLAKKVLPEITEEIIPHELYEVKEEFTSAVNDDKINILKGIMSSADAHHTGADVVFEQTPSTSVQKYQ